jgi:hypothetical protein
LFLLVSSQKLFFKQEKDVVVVVVVVVCCPGVTTHRGCIFHSPVAGFSLLVFEVS